MPFRTVLQNLERIDTLIRLRATGTPDDMADKLGISRATWFRWLEQLTEDLGLPIVYDEYRSTYYYSKRGVFMIKFIEEPDSEVASSQSSSKYLQLKSTLWPSLLHLPEEIGGFILEIL